MKKSQIIIIILAAILSFGGSFAFSKLFLKPEPVAEAASESTNGAESDVPGYVDDGPAGGEVTAISRGNNLARSMTEKQLENLIYDIREKQKEHDVRAKELDLQEKRIQVARETLQTDVDRLDRLRVQITSSLAQLKDREDKLKQSIIEVEELEKTNLKQLAKSYESMKADQASKAMIYMIGNAQVEDAVMILYFMDTMKSGKLLASISDTRPEVAAMLSDRFTRIKESR